MSRRNEFEAMTFKGIKVDAGRVAAAMERNAKKGRDADSGHFAASRVLVEREPKFARWYCLHVESGREFAVENDLDRMGVEALAPKERFIKVSRRNVKQECFRAFYPSYVLVRCVASPEAFQFLSRRPYVWQIVGGSNGHHVIRDEDISVFKKLLDSDEVPRIKTDKTIGQGDRAMIHLGPFAGFDCTVTSVKWCRMAKASVRIRIHGRDFDIESMPVAFLKKL